MRKAGEKEMDGEERWMGKTDGKGRQMDGKDRWTDGEGRQTEGGGGWMGEADG